MRTWTAPAGLHAPAAAANEERVVLTCRFISPVFGGGVDPKRPDPQTPVRSSAIRGQLRYWWRATHGDLTLDALRARETRLFGGVHDGPKASKIVVVVTRQPTAPQRLDVFKQGSDSQLIDPSMRNLAYGALPLRSNDNQHQPLWIYDGDFEVELRCASVQDLQELTLSLWAWLHFGGLGARTRRGFGAIELIKAENWSLSSIEQGWPPQSEATWPTLGNLRSDLVRVGSFRRGREAQEHLLKCLQDMRQTPGIGRNPGHRHPGRWRWPEPDAIRALYPSLRSTHNRPIHNPRIDKFPRAAFGAPIIFHYKKEHGEPSDMTLVPLRQGQQGPERLFRFGSSLILRPHAIGNGRYEALALRLHHPAPAGWALLREGQVRHPGLSTTLTPAEARRIQPLAMTDTISLNAVDAYLLRLRNL